MTGFAVTPSSKRTAETAAAKQLGVRQDADLRLRRTERPGLRRGDELGVI
jgi:hypothetical protein